MKYYKEKFKIQISEKVICDIHYVLQLYLSQVSAVQLGGYSLEEVKERSSRVSSNEKPYNDE